MSKKITVLDASAMACIAGAMRWRLSFNTMSKHVRSRCLETCLQCGKNRTIARKNGDKCSSITNQSHQHWCVIESMSCVDSYFIVESDSVQFMCIESRLEKI